MMSSRKKIRQQLAALSRDELNVLAKKLRIKGYRKLNLEELREHMRRHVDPGQLSAVLGLNWWNLHHNHVYGAATFLGLAIPVLFYFVSDDPVEPIGTVQERAAVDSDGDAVDDKRHPDRFAGTWVNENTETDAFTRIRIGTSVTGFAMELWGNCLPPPCYKGRLTTVASDSEDGTLTFLPKISFMEVIYDFTVLADGRVRLRDRGRYTDGSGRPQYENTQYFVRESSLP